MNFNSGIAGRVSEKHGAIREAPARGRTYGHVAPNTMRDRAHMGIQRDPAVAATIKDIMVAGGVAKWRDTLSEEQRDRYVSLDVPGSAAAGTSL